MKSLFKTSTKVYQKIGRTGELPKMDLYNDIEMHAANNIAMFRRSEVRTGRVVGEGSFSSVVELLSIKMKNNRALSTNKVEHQRKELFQLNQQSMLEQCSGRSTQSKYVVKHLNRKLLRHPKTLERAANDLIQEANILSQVDHPNIIKLRGTSEGGASAFESGKFDGFFLILDRLSETLEKRVDKWNELKLKVGKSYYNDTNNRFMVHQKSCYALQMAQALRFLHDRHIIYRDLKPQNIGFCRSDVNRDNEVLQLFDFGLSRYLPDPEREYSQHINSDGEQGAKHKKMVVRKNGEELYRMSMVGTRRYMGVEVINNKYYNCKADVYSFAMVYHEMLSQTRPFDTMNRHEHQQQVCKDGVRPHIYQYYGVPKVIQQLLRQAWEHKVSKRLTMHEVCEQLETVLSAIDRAQTYCSQPAAVVPSSKPLMVKTDGPLPSLATIASNSGSSDGGEAGGPAADDPANSAVVVHHKCTGFYRSENSGFSEKLLIQTDAPPVPVSVTEGSSRSSSGSTCEVQPHKSLTSSFCARFATIFLRKPFLRHSTTTTK